MKPVLTFGLKTNKVPEVIVCRLALGDFIVRFRLNGMYNIWEFDGILNEEDGNVVSDQVPIPLGYSKDTT